MECNLLLSLLLLLLDDDGIDCDGNVDGNVDVG